MSGSNVAGLFNYGSDASDALEVTSAQDPTYGATAFHGGPGITFASGQGLIATLNTPIPNGTSIYAWLVGRLAAPASGYMAFFGTHDNALVAYTGSAFYVENGNGGLAGNGVQGTQDTSSHLWEVVFDGTNSLLIDGSVVVTGGALPGGGAGITAIGLGCDTSGMFGAAQILSRLIVAVAPTGPQVTSMRSYLRGLNFPDYTGSSYGIP